MWQQQNGKVLCCSALALLCLNKEGAENITSAKVASQECEREFKVSFTDSSSIPLPSVGIWVVGSLPRRHLKYVAYTPQI